MGEFLTLIFMLGMGYLGYKIGEETKPGTGVYVAIIMALLALVMVLYRQLNPPDLY